ncbi:MAG: hypothetical protein HKP55_08555 [Gammaproteobacteria bacterium]|nr:hypothetical protein [Gammaproteobacteria bacterium]
MPNHSSLKLFVAPGCPHCPGMIRLLSDMLKNGKISQLKMINIGVDPVAATKHNIRSVPTLLIGEHVLNGVVTEAEISKWLTHEADNDSLTHYFNEAFDQGQLEDVINDLDVKIDKLSHLLVMLCDLETPLTSRIAISAIFEHFENSPALQSLIPALCAQTENDSESVRTDVAHVLGLTGTEEAVPCLQKLAKDTFNDVRETAMEALEEIRQDLS